MKSSSVNLASVQLRVPRANDVVHPERVGEWVYKPDPPGVPPPPSPSYYDSFCGTSGWQWFWIIFGIIIVSIIMLSIFFPYGYYPHHHHTLPPELREDEGKRGSTACTTDETFDQTTQMCMMVPHFPRAISPAIQDPKVAPCTDMFRHACGKWIDEHTNENRGFSGLAALNGAAVKRIIMDPTVLNLNPFFQSCKATLVDPLASGMKRRMQLDDTKLTQVQSKIVILLFFLN